jgi:hypothetical protein
VEKRNHSQLSTGANRKNQVIKAIVSPVSLTNVRTTTKVPRVTKRRLKSLGVTKEWFLLLKSTALYWKTKTTAVAFVEPSLTGTEVVFV